MQKIELENGVKVIFRNGFVNVTHPENFEMSPAAVNEIFTAVAETCKKNACYRVLGEGKLNVSKMNSWDSFNTGTQVGEIRGLQLACLFEDFVPDERFEFFKTVAANRGVRVEIFNRRGAALEWLGVTEDRETARPLLTRAE